MEKIKQIVNHPLSKGVACGLAGGIILIQGHPVYSGFLFGVAAREILLAFKAE
tara:strand:- start:403 stop:561 length:159 start_codon:yes stop_codon:yes gene_type:complete